MTWKYIRDGKEEEVKMERWMWCVQYVDGSSLKQFDDEGIFHQFQEIQQDKVAVFMMVKTDRTEGNDYAKEHAIFVKEGMRIFHYYQRHRLRVVGKPDIEATVYVFGWKNPNGSSTYMYILPSDGVMIGTEGELSFVGGVVQKGLGM